MIRQPIVVEGVVLAVAIVERGEVSVPNDVLQQRVGDRELASSRSARLGSQEPGAAMVDLVEYADPGLYVRGGIALDLLVLHARALALLQRGVVDDLRHGDDLALLVPSETGHSKHVLPKPHGCSEAVSHP